MCYPQNPPHEFSQATRTLGRRAPQGGVEGGGAAPPPCLWGGPGGGAACGPPRGSRYAIKGISICTANIKQPSILYSAALSLYIITMPQNYNIHSHGLLQIDTSLPHSSQCYIIHSQIIQDMKSLSPYLSRSLAIVQVSAVFIF